MFLLELSNLQTRTLLVMTFMSFLVTSQQRIVTQNFNFYEIPKFQILEFLKQ